MRLAFVLVLVSTAACSGSGATVGESDLSELQGAKKVTATTPEDPAPVSPLTRFECKTGRPFYDGAIHGATFTLRGDELAGDVAASPAGSPLAALGDQPSIDHDGGRLVLDADGGNAELVLYDNSDLTKGYVVVDENHADIFCTKTK